MAKQSMSQAVEEILEKLAALSEEDLVKLLEQHKDGDITVALCELDEFSHSEEFRKVMEKHGYLQRKDGSILSGGGVLSPGSDLE